MQLYGAALAATRTAWLHHDLLNKRTNRLSSGCPIIGCQMHIELSDRVDVQRFIVGWQADNRRRSHRCYHLFEAVFIGFQFLQPCSKRAGRVVILFDKSHELGNARASIGEIGFGADTIGIADA